MKMKTSPIEIVAACWVNAIEHHLPDHEFDNGRLMRPDPRNCDMFLFPQTWGSTALGFGGIGGAAMTTVYTTVVIDDFSQNAVVYFNGKLAYILTLVNDKFYEDLRKMNMCDRSNSFKYKRDNNEVV